MFSLRIVKGQELASGAVTEMRLPPPPARLSIGRDPDLDWPLPDRTLALSARHCEIIVSAGGALLRDLSTNGTFLNGSTVRMAHDHALVAGDQFEVGPYHIAFIPLVGAHAAGDTAVDLLITTGKLPAARVRGGDPAAAPGAVAPAVLPPPPVATTKVDDGAPLTRIRPPPKVAAGSPVRAAVDAPRGAAPNAAAEAPRAAAPPAGSDAMLAALASGLGVDAAVFAHRDPAEIARRLGLVARAAVSGLRRLLEQETRARRRLGSRQGTLNPIRDANPLRLARTPEDAMVRLLAGKDEGTATLRNACDELAAHHEQLLAAFAGAARRLAEEMDPASLDAALGSPTGRTLNHTERKAQLWDLYVGVWHRLGLAPDETWVRGFTDAAMQHVARAYDEGSDEAHDAGRAGAP